MEFFELEATEERIARFHRILAQLRVRATPQEFPSVASGYKEEILRMEHEILDYLTRHSTQPASEAA